MYLTPDERDCYYRLVADYNIFAFLRLIAKIFRFLQLKRQSS